MQLTGETLFAKDVMRINPDNRCYLTKKLRHVNFTMLQMLPTVFELK